MAAGNSAPWLTPGETRRYLAGPGAIRLLLAILFLVPGAAGAQIGEAPASLLAALAQHSPVQAGRDAYRGANGLLFRLETRGGRLYAVHGEGQLDEENLRLMADLVATASGYGESIRPAVANFLAQRLPQAAGAGEAAVGVEEYRLEFTVTGESEPFEVQFGFALHEVPEHFFPPVRHILGPADARFVVREFSDFQCPYCARFAERVLPELKERLLARGDVRFEYHHLPLPSIHANASLAAEAAECAADVEPEQGFWLLHDTLFERQRAWESLGDPAPYFTRLAGEVGLDEKAVADCLDERRHAQRVREAYQHALQLGLSGTPTVFVNGLKVRNHFDPGSYLSLIELLEDFGASTP